MREMAKLIGWASWSIALIAGAAAVAEGAPANPERAAAVLARIDLDRPGLEKVRQAVAAGDERTAITQLLHYYRTREMDYHFDPSTAIRDLPGIDADLHDPMKVPSVRCMPVGVHDTTTPADALARRLTFLGETVEFGDRVDWKHQLHDREWNFMLNRHTYFLTLVEAYRRFGDERYMAEFAERFLEWDQQVAPGYPRRLEAGIRMRHWTWLFPVAVTSRHFDEQVLTVFLDTMHATCEWLNARGSAGYGDSNQGAMAAVSVLQAATYFPEFRDAGEWARVTVETMRNHIFESTYADGVYRGRSPTYHNVTLREENWFYQLMKRAGAPVAEEFVERLNGMFDFAAAFTQPNLTIPQFGHTDRDFMEDRLLRWGRQADRPDHVYLATEGKEGAPPAWTSRIFPEGKFALLRSPWTDGRDAHWSMMDYGPRGRGADRALAVELYADGQPLIVAPGRYTYDAGGRDAFLQTRFQNTVSINGGNMVRNVEPVLARSQIEGELKYLHAWHDGYSHLLPDGVDGSIIHERQLLMVRDEYWIVADLVRAPEVMRESLVIEQNWRFLPTEPQRLTKFPGAFATDYGTAEIAVIPLGGEAEPLVEEGWYSPKYGSKYPAPRLVYRVGNGPPWFMVTLLAPFGGDEPLLLSVERSVDETSLKATLVWRDGWKDDVYLSFGSIAGRGETDWHGQQTKAAVGSANGD